MIRAVDLFAGFGGFTEGAQQAGVDVVWAANHWPTAVDVHGSNHPRTPHVCQDLRQADWSALPAYDMLLASPACQGHSEAGRANRQRWGVAVTKRHQNDRSTAWAVVDCAESTRPRVLVVENVVAFREWQLYGAWRMALETLGYELQEHVVTASLHAGVPQRRERLFMVGVLGGGAKQLRFEQGVEPGFGSCVDWNEGAWRPIASATPWAQRLLEAAQKKLGERGILQYVSRGGRVRVDEPIRTITTKDQWLVLRGNEYRPLSLREYARAQGFPETYTWPDELARAVAIRGLGNAVPPPLARTVVQSTIEAASKQLTAA